MSEAFLNDDASVFSTASARLVSALEKLPAAHRPDPQLIATELHYYRLQPFHKAWIIMTIGVAMAITAMLVRRKWFDIIAIIPLIAGFGIISYGLWLRWQIAGRIPAANMYESLLFLGWGMGAFTILSMIFIRHRIVPVTASVMGALSLILSEYLPMDHYIGPIRPALLDTIWMSIHVPVIMVSYSVLAMACLIAHVQLVVMTANPRRQAISDTIDWLHYWYVHVGAFLLLIGIITGSMWGASSWGRHWGWDPKEVWSLVAFLGYVVILHVRLDRGKMPRWIYAAGALFGVAVFVWVIWKVEFESFSLLTLSALAGAGLAMFIFVTTRGRFATALKSVLAFWLIIMTYVGVNYVLGIGLHQYGFGTGAVVHYMFLIGGIDLALIVLCCIIYMLRAGPRSLLVHNSPI